MKVDLILYFISFPSISDANASDSLMTEYYILYNKIESIGEQEHPW